MGVTFKKVVGASQAIAANRMHQELTQKVMASVKKLVLGGAKATVVQDSVLVEAPGKSPEDLMKELGLLPSVQTTAKERILMPGDKVRYTNELFTWRTEVPVGAEGVVVRSMSPVKEALQWGMKYALLEVDFAGVLRWLHQWEVAPVVVPS